MLALTTFAIRQILGWILLTSSVSKLLNLSEFRKEVSKYPFVTSVVATPASVAIPAIELLLSVNLLLGAYWRLAAIASIALLLVFLVAVIAAIVSGRRDSCGCGGLVPTKTLGSAHIFTIALMAGSALFLALSNTTAAAIDVPWNDTLLSQSHSALTESALLVGLAAVNALLIAAATSTTWNLRKQRQIIDLVKVEG